MPWFSTRPPGFTSRATWRAYTSIWLDADVLDHADARHRVEGLVAELAVVRHPDLHAVGEAALRRALARERGLRLGERDARRRCTPWCAAAWMAKLPQPQPMSSTRWPGFSSSFVQTSSSFASWASSSVVAPREKSAQL